MIFTDKKLTSKSILIRFYEWADKERGYGDAGTHCYRDIPLLEFKVKSKKRMDGSFYYTYTLNSDYGKKLLNNNHWWCEYGYTLANEKDRTNEIVLLQRQLKRLKNG